MPSVVSLIGGVDSPLFWYVILRPASLLAAGDVWLNNAHNLLLIDCFKSNQLNCKIFCYYLKFDPNAKKILF